ncbi:MAG: hypothetical protein ACRENY_10110 [Candidatus Dormibacteria bacterium]
METGADRLEARLRYELDPRRRLRRDGPKLAAGLAVVVLVGSAYLVRARRRRRAQGAPDVDWIAEMPKEWRERLQGLLAEAAERHPTALEPARNGKSRKRSLGTTLGLRAARLVAPVVISAAAERIAGRQGGAGPLGRPSPAGGSPPHPRPRARWWQERAGQSPSSQPAAAEGPGRGPSHPAPAP